MPEVLNSNNAEEDFEEIEAEVNRTLFLRAIPDKTTEDELYELFLQAGPLEKVAIPQNKNIAFVTYKHSVSAPYAKELFSDTRLHGMMLNVGFRTGSSHMSHGRGGRSGNHHSTPYNRPPHHQGYSQDNRNSRNSGNYSSSSRPNHNNYHNRSGNQMGGSIPAAVIPGAYSVDPFNASPQSMPNTPITGYRTSGSREYVPQPLLYVPFNSPPEAFIGGAPVNHPNHPVPLEDRRQRLMNQQRLLSQAETQRRQYEDRRRGDRRY